MQPIVERWPAQARSVVPNDCLKRNQLATSSWPVLPPLVMTSSSTSWEGKGGGGGRGAAEKPQHHISIPQAKGCHAFADPYTVIHLPKVAYR